MEWYLEKTRSYWSTHARLPGSRLLIGASWLLHKANIHVVTLVSQPELLKSCLVQAVESSIGNSFDSKCCVPPTTFHLEDAILELSKPLSPASRRPRLWSEEGSGKWVEVRGEGGVR